MVFYHVLLRKVNPHNVLQGFKQVKILLTHIILNISSYFMIILFSLNLH